MQDSHVPNSLEDVAVIDKKACHAPQPYSFHNKEFPTLAEPLLVSHMLILSFGIG